ncbi:peptidase [Pectobacterium carotovorum subsp. carotovorum]|nr:peptidase [Pectobacterium carotovorum subsp. carotovorum]GLX46170.1 peptidase [Pectobacterium carotovorum subsp. carotovorum]
MNLFERLLMRRLCEEAPVDGGPGGGGPYADAPAADKPADAPADNPADAPKDGDKPGAEKTEAEVAAEKEAAEKAAKENKEQGAPEKYEFKAAEGQTLDAEALAVFEPLARELGLTNEQGQKFVDAYASKILPQIQKQQMDTWQKTVEGWAETVKADKEIGGDKLTANLGKAQQAVMQFGGEDLKQALQETGLGNHPALVKAFVKIGHAMSEDKMLGGGSNGEQLSAAQVLYGK